MIEELNDIFTAFDQIIKKNNCERIKTIGDAYLCVCGMPQEDQRHAENILTAAMEIMRFLKWRNQTATHRWEIRAGVHSGRVVGGVVGVEKYIYDVFGDTINTASRLESFSEAMTVNVSEVTYILVKDRFRFTPRGAAVVKGKGEMKMFHLEY
ncbi:MAG: adenylate/guanylate cyclase domain-containing protein [Candidatus Competibacterales bacterium]